MSNDKRMSEIKARCEEGRPIRRIDVKYLLSQLDEAKRREREAVALLQTIGWVGSGAKGRIEDAIGILTGRGPSDGEAHHDA